MKGTVVELFSEGRFRFIAQLLNRDHADLVAGGLSRSEYVALDFRLHGQCGLR